MSRVGKKPIKIPSGVSVKLTGTVLEVSGPKGLLKRDTFGRVFVSNKDDEISVLLSENEELTSYLGLYRTLLKNMIDGVSVGFSKVLEIQGTGYRASMSAKTLVLNLGFSHDVKMQPPDGISFSVDAAGKITISGSDKELVGQVAADVRSIRPVEPYKGKGVRYAGERVVIKPGKSGKSKK